MFVTEHDVSAITSGTLIIDVSCDEGMGFSLGPRRPAC
jgi:hypothetical protein